jgi:hypothetical protein
MVSARAMDLPAKPRTAKKASKLKKNLVFIFFLQNGFFPDN